MPGKAKEFENQVVVIAGGAGGIGKALALGFASQGARLVIADAGTDLEGRDADDSVAQRSTEELVALGSSAICFTEDLARSDARARLLRHSLDTYGSVDILIYCAGYRSEQSVLQMEEHELGRAMEVHAHAPIDLVRRFAQHWVQDRTPGISIVCTSPLAFFGASRQSALSAAGGAVVAFCKSASLDLRKYGVRVHALLPTARTRMTEDLPVFKKLRPEVMEPDHLLPLVQFLCSDAGKDVSGEVLGIAGTRCYSVQSRETAGIFAEGTMFEVDEIQKNWRGVFR
ncbi:MAG: SDR family NAD(P)-dependent oxidoreductase [Myxococcota bacterium]